jgi:DNA topoisomerase-2
MVVFVDRPTFSGQTKTKLCGGNLEKDLYFNEKILKFIKNKNGGLLDKIKSKYGGRGNTKTKKLVIEKYLAAKYSKSRDSEKRMKCKFFMAEGKSAASQFKRGCKCMGLEASDYWGIYELKGKPINVRTSNGNRNVELNEIIQILGLVRGEDYSNINDLKKLNYGKICILTDADNDGFHICGLIVNLFYTLWPSLTKHPNFITYIQTPYIRIYSSKNDRNSKLLYEFRSKQSFKNFIKTTTLSSKYNIRYLKGIGTNSPDEMKDIVKKLSVNTISIRNDNKTFSRLDLAFGKKFADKRKIWVSTSRKDDPSSIDNEKYITSADYIDTYVWDYSRANCDRSIPQLADGLKTCQRKVLWAIRKRKFTVKKRVTILSSCVSSMSEYPHGEDNIHGTISKMAWCWTGANNMNYLSNDSGFGTRVDDKDSQPRYAETKMMPWLNYIFREEDDPILNYLVERNVSIEPTYFVPIIPMLLVNGCGTAIGTGFSSRIPKFNPLLIIERLIMELDKTINPSFKWIPWYIDYVNNDTIKMTTDKRGIIFYETYGTMTHKNNMIYISELPPSKREIGYQNELNKKKIKGKIIDWHRNNKPDGSTFRYDIKLGKINDMSMEGLIKEFSLYEKISLQSMHCNHNGKVIKFKNINDIFMGYFSIRYKFYKKRIKYHINVLLKKMDILRFKILFIKNCIMGKIILKNKPIQNVIDSIEKNISKISTYKFGEDDPILKYKFLYMMPMVNQTRETYKRMIEQYNKRLEELNIYKKLTVAQLWKRELFQLRDVILKYDILGRYQYKT